MKLPSSDQIRWLDAYTIENEPISSIELMDRASAVFKDWFCEKFQQVDCLVLCGPGNNGGDGISFARQMRLDGRSIKAVLIAPLEHKPSADLRSQIESYEAAYGSLDRIHSIDKLAVPDQDTVLIDALFGSGLQRPLVGLYAQTVEWMNELPNLVASIDLPSGIKADGDSTGPCVQADATLSFEFPKRSFLLPDEGINAGDWSYRSIGLHPNGIALLDCEYSYFDLSRASKLIQHRNPFSHKGTNGHCLLIAGCASMPGAALLSAKSCITAGAGKVSLMSDAQVLNALSPYCPEIMQRRWLNALQGEELKGINAILIGPGLGSEVDHTELIRSCIETDLPLVLDADALNCLSSNKDLLSELRPDHILTPHIGEFERLFGASKNEHERLSLLRQKALDLGCVILLKGRYTAIAGPDGKISFNSSGGPSLATAGSGDVLSGLICALLGQGYDPITAAQLSAFIHGLSAEVEQARIRSERSTASRIIDHLPQAFAKVLKG